MQIEFTGRNMEVTRALKEHVRDKLGHTARALEDVVSAHVILAVEKYRHIAEIVLRRRRGVVTGRASTEDMYQSVQKAIERIEKQGRRSREKLIGRKRRGTGAKTSARSAAAEPVTRGRRAAAGTAVEPEPEAPQAQQRVRLVEEALDRVKPIAVEEAVLLLEKARRPFVAFRSSTTGRMGVVYRRADGAFGLVEAD